MNQYKSFTVNESVPNGRTLLMSYRARRVALPSPRDDSSNMFRGYNSSSNRYYVTEHRFPSYSSWEFYWETWDPNQVAGTNPVVGTPAPPPQRFAPIITQYGGDRIDEFPSKTIGNKTWKVRPIGFNKYSRNGGAQTNRIH